MAEQVVGADFHAWAAGSSRQVGQDNLYEKKSNNKLAWNRKRIIEWLGLEGTSRIIKLQPPLPYVGPPTSISNKLYLIFGKERKTIWK